MPLGESQLEKNGADLYGEDFFEWTRRTAALLRKRSFDQVDIEHLAGAIKI